MIKKYKPKSTFGKNVLTVMSGTIIAQAIPIAISPILTRIYTPEEFGFFALYMAFISIGAAIATGKYEMAILLPKNQTSAKYLVFISTILSLFSSLIIMFIYILFEKHINALFNIEEENILFYFVPLGIFLFAFYNILLQWMNRQRQYSLMTKNRFVQAFTIALFQLLVSYIKKISFGLIIADIIGRVIAIFFIFRSILNQIKVKHFSIKKIFYLMKRYKKFPQLEMPATVLNIASFQLPYMIVPIAFSSTIAGFYFLVFRVLMMPISLIGNAILEVFKNRAIDDFNKYNSCRSIYKKIFILLFSIGFIPTLILIFFAPQLFIFIFGKEWAEAGVYAQILAPMALLRLISAPLSFVFFIREKLELDLLIQLIFIVLTVVSLSIGYIYLDSILLVGLLSISGSIFYIIQLVLSYRLSYVD